MGREAWIDGLSRTLARGTARRDFLKLLGAAAGGLLLGRAPDAEAAREPEPRAKAPKCTTDTECATGERCVGGRCTAAGVACPACGTCTACDAQGSCGGCQGTCPAATLCAEALADDGFLAVEAALVRRGFARDGAPTAAQLLEEGAVIRSALVAGFAGRRRDERASLVYTAEGKKRAAYAVILRPKGRPYALGRTDTGKVKKVRAPKDPFKDPTVLSRSAPRGGQVDNDVRCADCELYCALLPIGCGAVAALACGAATGIAAAICGVAAGSACQQLGNDDGLTCAARCDLLIRNHLQGDEGHCGSCTRACVEGQRCCLGQCRTVASDQANCGTCFTECQGNKICCDGECVNPQNDEQHCGGCGGRCTAGDLCCLGQCRDVDTDDAHCGRCLRECTGNKVCCGGECRAPQDCCPPGQRPARGGICVAECDADNRCPGGQCCKGGACVSIGGAQDCQCCESGLCVQTCPSGECCRGDGICVSTGCRSGPGQPLSGCCKEGFCVPGTAGNACGNDGGACSNCTSSGLACCFGEFCEESC